MASPLPWRWRICRCAPAVPIRSAARWCVTALALAAVPTPLAAQAVLRQAEIAVTYADRLSCEVEARFRVSPGPASVIEHRLPTAEGSAVALIDASRPVQAPRPAGRTQVLEIPAAAGEEAYGFRYRVVQPPDLAYRCPLWLPTTPADGQSRGIEVRVSLPAGAAATGGGFPSFDWGPDGGRTLLGHVPAFVVVPFSEAGTPAAGAWNLSRIMDTTAVLLLVTGMAAFILRKRG